MGGTSIYEANGDVPLGGVAFSQLGWLAWGYIFNRVTRMGPHIFGFVEVRQPSYLRLAKAPECSYCS